MVLGGVCAGCFLADDRGDIHEALGGVREIGFRVDGVTGNTRGFYERTAALYHHARGTPPKRLFWVAVPGGRWRIDWPRTNRGV